MTEDLKKHEQTIKKKHSFGWTPKYEEKLRTDFNTSVFIAIASKTFEKLKWDIVFQDDISIEAKRKNSYGTWTEKITITYENGEATIKSSSLGNEMWDMGRNSKRVKLFIHAFHQTVKELDSNALAELEKEIEKANKWDDYEVPERLPFPPKSKTPNFYIPLVGGITASLLIGYIIAFLSVEGFYIIGIFEFGVALLLGFILKQLIQLSNYTNYSNLHKLLIAMIVITYVSNQYFQYQIIVNKHNFETIGFFEFIKYRFEAGLTIKGLNTGWIGLVISWIIQLVFTYLFSILRLSSALTAYKFKRIPVEVIDFACYHFVKEKTEDEVRHELEKMGWTDRQSQDEVFESIGAIQDATELNRME